MKTIQIIIASVFISQVGINAFAQQVPMYTHYMHNTLVINPAYAGSRDALTVTGLYRSQWVNFDGAPVTQTLTMHSPLANENIGLGLSVTNDQIGPVSNTSVFGNFAYIMQVSKKAKLALGLSAGANFHSANLRALELENQNDVVFQNDIRNSVTPNFGFGAYYSMERFYVGISAHNLLENSFSEITQSNGRTFVGKEQRHYFLIAGAMIKLSDRLEFKPTTLLKFTQSAPAQADVTASFIYASRLTLGAMYRTGEAVGVLAGIGITNQLYLGYSYDWSLGLETPTYNAGSHEVMLRYDFLSMKRKQIQSPRYF